MGFSENGEEGEDLEPVIVKSTDVDFDGQDDLIAVSENLGGVTGGAILAVYRNASFVVDECAADFNQDGEVGASDLILLLDLLLLLDQLLEQLGSGARMGHHP